MNTMHISKERKQELLAIANGEKKEKPPKKHRKVPEWWRSSKGDYLFRYKSILPARFPRRARCTLER